MDKYPHPFTSNPDTYYFEIIAAIKQIKSKVDKIVDCCKYPSNNQKDSTLLQKYNNAILNAEVQTFRHFSYIIYLDRRVGAYKQ